MIVSKTINASVTETITFTRKVRVYKINVDNGSGGITAFTVSFVFDKSSFLPGTSLETNKFQIYSGSAQVSKGFSFSIPIECQSVTINNSVNTSPIKLNIEFEYV